MRITILLAFLFLISACGPKIIYEQKSEIDGGKWQKIDAISYSFDATNDQQEYDIFLDVSHDENFSYQNLYVKIKTTFPDQKSAEDIVSLELSDGKSKSHGKCNGGRCETPIQLQSKIKFQQKGKYTIVLNQYSREEVVEGIKSLSLKIIEVEKE